MRQKFSYSISGRVMVPFIEMGRKENGNGVVFCLFSTDYVFTDQSVLFGNVWVLFCENLVFSVSQKTFLSFCQLFLSILVKFLPTYIILYHSSFLCATFVSISGS